MYIHSTKMVVSEKNCLKEAIVRLHSNFLQHAYHINNTLCYIHLLCFALQVFYDWILAAGIRICRRDYVSRVRRDFKWFIKRFRSSKKTEKTHLFQPLQCYPDLNFKQGVTERQILLRLLALSKRQDKFFENFNISPKRKNY